SFVAFSVYVDGRLANEASRWTKPVGAVNLELDLECENLAGEPIRLGGVLQPPVTVLALWATWCDACIIEMPLLAQVHREIEGVHLVGINVDEDKDAFERYISAHTLPFPMLRDAAGTIQE